ncbi:MAG: symmetrical bis(5'-nucleosyl)-tetraphosphatase [Burkholderiaceae bacterium]|jgi:bis(5'-nucleosyl)-tetraphosphatase (symmetrical)|nr:symmetrical bis(5'-nucleosyl)-tetraphosphatase [Burkholderiaceae bacterium]
MALYLIGDIQGCDQALERLLQEIGFSPSRDRLLLLGDLVNRGPDSLAVLTRVMALGEAAQTVLGNHDLHLLGTAVGARRAGRRDTLQDILNAPERDALLGWLRRQPLALAEHGVLAVHAGVLPSWTLAQTLALAGELQAALRGPGWRDFLHEMYGNQPGQWSEQLSGSARLRVIVNALTRLRFCTADGRMEFDTTSAPGSPQGRAAAAGGYLPWFDAPGRRTAGDVLAFGHWSTLGWLAGRPDLIALDTGCVWGGFLSAVRLGPTAHERELIQVRCPQAQAPE